MKEEQKQIRITVTEETPGVQGSSRVLGVVGLRRVSREYSEMAVFEFIPAADPKKLNMADLGNAMMERIGNLHTPREEWWHVAARALSRLSLHRIGSA